MKIILLLLFPLFSLCQKPKNGYIIAKGGGVKYGKADVIGMGSLSFGGKLNKMVGLGLGAHVMQFKGSKEPYIPIFLEGLMFDNTKKVSPIFGMQVGLGIYNERIDIGNTSVETNGGLFLSPSIGILTNPAKGPGAVFSVSYINSAFTTKTGGRQGITEKTSNTDGFSISVGIKFRIG